MKHRIRILAVIAISLAISAAFTMALLAYTRPMEDASYNLSLGWEEGEALPDDWSYDDKGWTVFTQENDTVTKLKPDGFGGFDGLRYLGQTFYYSRTMYEDLDSPILRITAASPSIAVFLDDQILYTDCPELDNRIGHLTLPMMEEYREIPIVIALPSNYQGRTLTIAQSSPENAETQTPKTTVWPCNIVFECGFSYESGLISECFQTAIPVTLVFFAGLLFLATFVWQTILKNTDVRLLCIALTLLFYMLSQISSVSFFSHYFTILDNMTDLCQKASLAVLLIFLSLQAGKKKLALCIFTALYSISVCICLFLDMYVSNMNNLRWFFWNTLPTILGFAGLLSALLFGLIFWRKESRFYHLFLLLMLTEAACYGCRLLLDETFRADMWEQFTIMISPAYFLWQLFTGSMLATVISASAVYIQSEWSRRTETRLMAQHGRLMQKSYKNLQRQHEEVMMIRHDMAKHIRLLRQMTREDQIADYLDSLLEQNKKIRPVIQSGNETLDIILNGKLAEIEDSGAKLQIENTVAPETLPLSDADLCSLIVNIIDNAIDTVSAPDIQHPYIKLDIHISNSFFVFNCKNAVSQKCKPSKTEKPQTHAGKTVAKHGLGLKIIRQIANRYNALLETEQGTDYYEVTAAFPIDESMRL